MLCFGNFMPSSNSKQLNLTRYLMFGTFILMKLQDAHLVIKDNLNCFLLLTKKSTYTLRTDQVNIVKMMTHR